MQDVVAVQVVQAQRHLQRDASTSAAGSAEVGGRSGREQGRWAERASKGLRTKAASLRLLESSKHIPGCWHHSLRKPQTQTHEGCMPLAGVPLDLPASITPSAPAHKLKHTPHCRQGSHPLYQLTLPSDSAVYRVPPRHSSVTTATSAGAM